MKNGVGAICLKGSIDIVCEFFEYGINSILYQRGLYPAEEFIQQEKYGLPLLVTSNVQLKRYLDVVFDQMRTFLHNKNVHKIVVVIIKLDTMETVERWQFDVDLEKNQSVHTTDPPQNPNHIQESIRGVVRQITASVTFLPILEGSHSFDILLYTDKDVELPNSEWSDTNARLINNGEHVQLRGFTTNVHRVTPVVSYRPN